MTQYNNSGSDFVVIKVRGRKIRILVDTEEIVRNKFVIVTKIKGIKIRTVSITSEKKLNFKFIIN